MALNNILALIDPTSEEQPAVERGLDTARITGAKLHIYCCVDEENDQRSTAALTLKFLQQADSLGVKAESEIEIGNDWRDKVIAAASRTSADIVLKHSVEHSDVDREKRITADWNLMRLSPCPVLMIKNYNNWQSRRILAAINTLSTDDQHLKLNSKIISFALRFGEAYGSDAHFINAFQDRNHEPSAEKVAAQCGVPADHVHIDEGPAVEAISSRAAQLEADLIIIGTVGRTGIKGRVVGNTSEHLLDHTRSDILVLN